MHARQAQMQVQTQVQSPGQKAESRFHLEALSPAVDPVSRGVGMRCPASSVASQPKGLA